MNIILIIEMFAVLVLGIGFICETKLRHSVEAKIKALNTIIQAKNDEIDHLKKCQHKRSISQQDSEKYKGKKDRRFISLHSGRS